MRPTRRHARSHPPAEGGAFYDDGASAQGPRRVAPAAAVRLAAATQLVCAACTSSSTDVVPPTELPAGTWGNENVGLLVGDALAHVHVGCTKGDFPAPVPLDEEQRFNVSGSYLVKAYPVAVGPTMPARFAGVLRGNELTFTVAVNDTVDDELVVLGPVTAFLGREPEMGPCPICEAPAGEPHLVPHSARTRPAWAR